jgi:hypothetical protein
LEELWRHVQLELAPRKSFIFEYIIFKLKAAMKKVELDKIDPSSIKKLLIEIGSPIIPLTLIFKALGFSGITGIEWGILAGAITALATEVGYRVEKIGRSIVLVQCKDDLTQRKDATEAVVQSETEIKEKIS